MKNILRLLLSKFYSKQENELVAHQAMPSANANGVIILTPIKTIVDEWENVYTGIAPSDGYVTLNFQPSENYSLSLGSAQTPNIGFFSTPQRENDSVYVSCPVTKGQSFSMSARYAKNISCKLIKLIGGG